MRYKLEETPRLRRIIAALRRKPSDRGPLPGTLLSEHGRARWVRLAGDAAAIVALCVAATLTFVLAYGAGRVWVACLGGIAIGVGVGTVAALRSWRSMSIAAALAAAYFAFGGLLAMPSTTIAGFIPTGRTIAGLASGSIQAWRASLTLDPPIGETGSLLVVPLIAMMLAAAGGISIALRSTRPTFAWLPPAAAGLLGIAFGTAISYQPLVVALSFAVVSLVWTSYRRRAGGRVLLRSKTRFQWHTFVLGAVVLAVASGGVLAVSPYVVPTTSRSNLRAAVEPPLDLTVYPSPLQGFRANISEHKEDVLMEVSNLPQGARIRLATLDSYDGFRMGVSNSAIEGADSGTFKRVGAQINTESSSAAVPVTITIRDYSGPWVPTVGETRSISFGGDRALALADSFFYNRASGTGVDTAGMQSGDTYTVQAVVDPQPKAEQVKAARQSRLDLPPVDPIPDVARDLAQRWAGSAATTGEAALRIQSRLQQGYFSHGVDANEATSLSGHSYQRIQALLSTELRMVGDEEQYAVAMVMMARNLGIPSRVVYGYKPTGNASSAEVRGKDVSAWAELSFDGLGWVVFDPTPDKDRKPTVDTDPDQAKPRPHVDNPPPPPVRPDRLPPDNADPKPPESSNDRPWDINWRLIAGITVGVSIPLVFIVLPIALIVGAKLRRRKSRMTAGEVANRVAGGWAELTDKARDLGSTPSPYATRTEQAEAVSETFPRVSEGADPQVLARLADTTVFGPEEVTSSQAQTYWAGVDRATKGMMASVPWWRRYASFLSLKSFRKFRSR